MTRIPVVSTMIKSIGYDRASTSLEIEFSKGRLYEYSGVPEAVFTQFLSASSKGKFFLERIRDNYRSMQIR